MNKFWVLWTYVANYGGPIEVNAESAEKAANTFASWMSDDFQARGTVYVFDRPPVATRRRGKLEPSALGELLANDPAD